MKLRHPRSKLTQYKEVSAPKRTFGRKLTQWIYLAILLSLVVYAIFYVGYQIFYFDQRGLVTVHHVVISSARGGRILKEAAGAGDHVRKGALLLRIASPNVCRRSADEKVIRELKMKNGFDGQKVRVFIQQRNTKRHELNRMQYQRSMELFSDNTARIRALQDALANLDGDIDVLRHEIKLRNDEIKKLSANNTLDDACRDELIRAPADGTIVSIQHRTYEVVQRSDPVMDFVKDDAPVLIHALFRNEYYESLSLGKKVQIRFPDKSFSKGRVIKIESTSVPFAVNTVRKNYAPARTRILAVIEPLDKKDVNLWKSFMEMEVEVKGWGKPKSVRSVEP